MGRVTSKGNEAKSKMKQPSDMPTHRDLNTGGSDLWSNMLLLNHGDDPTDTAKVGYKQLGYNEIVA